MEMIFIQIFMPCKSYKDTAKYLDDLRLNKRVIECYQIAEMCLMKMRLIEIKSKSGKLPPHANHPITLMIYNNGKPYLPDILEYMGVLSYEWVYNRSKNRGKEFQSKIDKLSEIVYNNKESFDWNAMPKYYCYGNVRGCFGNKIYDMYQKLLDFKWNQGSKAKIVCSIKIK